MILGGKTQSQRSVATRQINPYANKIAILGNSIVGQNNPLNASGHGTWAANTIYSPGTLVVPNVFNFVGGYRHLKYSSSGGTSGTVEPIWPTVIGGTVVDGGITWTAQARTDETGYGWGFWTFAQMLSGQRLEEVWFGGLSGKQSPDILKNLPAALAADPDVVYFAAMFENDCWPGSAPSLSGILANWNAFVGQADSVRNSGKRVMLNTVLPNGSIDGSGVFTSYVSGNGTKAWNWLNARIREFAHSRPDVILFDAASVYADPNPANPVWPENTTTYLAGLGSGQFLKKTDGVHPYVSGAFLLGKALATVIQENFPPAFRFPHANDNYSRSANPDNGGTSGNLGTGMTAGTVPSLMRMGAPGTIISAVASIVPRKDTSGNFAQCAYVASAADNTDYTQAVATWTPGGAFAIGSFVQAFGEIKINANPTLMRYAEVWIRMIEGAVVNWRSTIIPIQQYQDWGQMMDVDTLLTLKTPPFAIPSGTTLIMLYARVFGRGEANFTASFGRLALVPYPIPDIS